MTKEKKTSKDENKPKIGKTDKKVGQDIPMKTLESTEFPENLEKNLDLSEITSDLSESSEKKGARRSKVDDTVEITQMLLAGMTIREVAEEGFTKSMVERISKRLRKKGRNRSSNQSSRREFLDYPYRKAMESVEESEHARELNLGSRIKRLVDDAFWMRLQAQVYSQALQGLGGQNKNSGDMFEKILLTKIASGGQNMSGQDLIQFASALKNVLHGEGQQSDILAEFLKLKQLEAHSVGQYKQIQTEAYEKAKSESNRDLITGVIEKGVELGGKLLKQPSIPNPGPSIPAASPLPLNRAQMEGESPGAFNVELQPEPTPILTGEPILENLRLPKTEINFPEAKTPISSVDDASLGYSNLHPVYGVGAKKAKGGK